MHLSPTESSTRGWETPQRICSYQRCLMWSEERTFWRRWRAQGRLFYRAFTHCRYGHLRLYPHVTGSSQVPQLNARCFKTIHGSIMWTFIVHLRAGLITSAVRGRTWACNRSCQCNECLFWGCGCGLMIPFTLWAVHLFIVSLLPLT